MATDTGVICQIEELRSVAFGSIGASYTAIGDPFENPIPFFILQNYTDADLLFSIDGTTDHIFLPSNGQLIVDISSNRSFADGLFFRTGKSVYVKRSGTPTSGSVYFSAFYGE